MGTLAKVMPITILYTFLCIKWLDKSEKLPVGQTRVLRAVHYPQFLLCLFWLWTFTRLENTFLTRNVFSQVGQQCQTGLNEIILSYISFEVIFFLESHLFQIKWAHQRWSSVTIKVTATTALLVDVLILISPSSSPLISSADHWEGVYWSYLCHGFFLEYVDIPDFCIVEQPTSAIPLPLLSSCLT